MGAAHEGMGAGWGVGLGGEEEREHFFSFHKD